MNDELLLCSGGVYPAAGHPLPALIVEGHVHSTKSWQASGVSRQLQN